MVNVVAAPADMAELFRTYNGYVIGLVKKLGIPPQEAEDCACEIFSRLYERNVIDMFDPDYHIVHDGRVVPARFKSFLSNQVALYVRGQRDRLNRHSKRELLLCDSQVDESGTRWLDVFGAAQWDDYSEISAGEFVTRMRGYLATVPKRNMRDTCDLVALFDELVSEIRETGSISYSMVRERFKISSTSAYSWVGWLRSCLANGREAMESNTVVPAQDFWIGGIKLTTMDVCSAISVLRESKGIMVNQPLIRAGHPLAVAAKGWYHLFSAEEYEKFPELAIVRGTHTSPADHVKRAVLHRLERMIAVAPVPVAPVTVVEVEPDPDPEEMLVYAMFQAGVRDHSAVEKLLKMARETYAA